MFGWKFDLPSPFTEFILICLHDHCSDRLWHHLYWYFHVISSEWRNLISFKYLGKLHLLWNTIMIVVLLYLNLVNLTDLFFRIPPLTLSWDEDFCKVNVLTWFNLVLMMRTCHSVLSFFLSFFLTWYYTIAPLNSLAVVPGSPT